MHNVPFLLELPTYYYSLVNGLLIGFLSAKMPVYNHNAELQGILIETYCLFDLHVTFSIDKLTSSEVLTISKWWMTPMFRAKNAESRTTLVTGIEYQVHKA